ncbi:MAG: hypothetical protein VB095_03640, partial [Anaerovorax sp.]|nr:hypothetical protein [Anaerovorax sp.]
SFYEEAFSDIHRWIDEWNVTEDSEPYQSANCYLNDIKEQWDKFLFDIVKTNLCYAQLLINNGDYIEAMNYLKKAEMENDDIEWFESNIYRIAIIEAYHEIFIAKEGVEQSLGDEAKKRCGILNKGYHSTYKRSLELYGALNNEYAFLLRDGALKQAYYQLRINMDEAFDYCEEAVKYAEDALKLVNTPKNQLAYSDTLLLRAMYWYSQGELEKANKDMDQVYWLKTKKDLDQTFFLYGVLEEGDILSNFFYDVCKLDLADHQDEKEMKFILEIISGNWKLVKVYMETALNHPNNMIVHRKKLHAILESINLVTKALANKKCFDEALYYCNEALSYWEKCGCPIYPVQMFVNDVYDLVTRKGKLLEKLGKAEESIQVFKGILSFNKVADITNYKTLSWVLQKREEVEWEFTLLFIEDFVVNEINFTFDESEYNFEEIVEKFNRIAMAYDYANDSHAEYYYACKVKWSESWNEKEDSCESLSAVAYSNSAMAYWYERNNELEKAITYYEKAMNCCERLYQITQDLEQMEGYKRISERIQKLSNDLKQVEVEQ